MASSKRGQPSLARNALYGDAYLLGQTPCATLEVDSEQFIVINLIGNGHHPLINFS